MMNFNYEPAYKELGLASQRKYPNEAMLAFLATQPKGKVLEIGCGSGANLWAIAKEGFEAYGQDNASTGIELCKQMMDSYGVTAELRVEDFHKLDYPDASFDIVVDIRSMQHTDEKQTVIDEVRRVLKPGGYFFSYHLTTGTSDTMFPGQGVILMSEPDARNLLSGFEVSTELCSRHYSDGRIANYLAVTAKKV